MPITLYRDNGELFYNDCKINKIREGFLYGTRLSNGKSVMIAISSRPSIRPMPTKAEPGPSIDWAEWERSKYNELHEFWHGKKRR